MRFCVSWRSDVFFLLGPLCACTDLVILGFLLPMLLADLLLDLLCDQINGCVEVAFNIFCKKIRTRYFQPDGTGKLAFGGLRLVVFDDDAGGDGKSIEMLELLDATDNVIFDGFGGLQVMRRKDQVHTSIMLPVCSLVKGFHHKLQRLYG